MDPLLLSTHCVKTAAEWSVPKQNTTYSACICKSAIEISTYTS